MNILEALDVALPELPVKTARRGFPKLDPRVIAKEHIEQGIPVVLAKMPGADSFVRLTPEQWKVLQLFDGERSFEQVAEALAETMAVPFSADDVKEFSSFLQEQTDFFYRTPLERNITLKQKLEAERHKRKRFAIKDITDITLHRWPRADDYLTKLKPYVEFVYTPWFTGLTLLCFAVMAGMWVDKFGEIWRDSFEFYNFADMGAWDLVEFWFLFGVMAFFHESAHGMTCKHFGGSVEKMEFLLMYFEPTFVCDVTQIWIVGDRKARLTTIIAGIWMDLVICFVATTIWWSTPAGMGIHNFAYKVILVSGIGVTILNLNPLIKLDGYYMFSELTGEVDLKERTTVYVSGWVRKYIFGLPVEVEYVPHKRRVFYIVYALLSGVYSYALIAFVVVFAYHVVRSYTPEWAWLPSLAIGGFMFKSRILMLGRFMKLVYLDKKERVRAWFTPVRMAVAGAVVLILLCMPCWPDFVEGRFVLEPVRRAIVRAEVPGVVEQVPVAEGQTITQGSLLVKLQNLQLESEAAKAAADFRVATARSTSASLRYAGFGVAERERQQAQEQSRTLAEELGHLQITSPIAGVVLTPRLDDLVGRYVAAGTELVEVADTSSLVARIYIPEFELRDVHVGANVRLHARSRIFAVSGTLTSLAPVSTEIDPGLGEKSQFTGLIAPQFYVGSVRLRNDGQLREGMSGTAKVFVRRRSLTAFGWRFMRDQVQRRFW
jgi:putative peptide zinc metalloprotease protein